MNFFKILDKYVLRNRERLRLTAFPPARVLLLNFSRSINYEWKKRSTCVEKVADAYRNLIRTLGFSPDFFTANLSLTAMELLGTGNQTVKGTGSRSRTKADHYRVLTST